MATDLFELEGDSDDLGSAAAALGQVNPQTHISSFQYLFLKRWIDLGIAIPVALLISPLLALIAIAIRIDTPGPALFRQRRIGRNFEPFVILKFRSLRVDEPDPCANYEMVKKDPRITRVGRWLRLTSLDEVPQIFNVIAGSMSLVGPRPLVESESQACLARHSERFLVLPGITGLQQVKARNSVSLDKRSDLHILLETPLRVLSLSGIYPE